MCGIVGVVNQKKQEVRSDTLQRMTDAIAHRGPDGEGIFLSGAIGLGHRRLAILDLSSAAQQPMKTADNRFVISYNGELYNFLELKKELADLGVQFTSRSDTEVVLKSFVQWSVAAFKKFNGMFALAIWDAQQQTLYLARDRYGIKPLYWSYQNDELIFGSEIKALLQHPNVAREICYPALNEYFTFQNIFSDRTLFKNIHTLNAGSYLVISAQERKAPKIKVYWDFSFSQTIVASKREVAEQLQHLFIKAVKHQLVADVPVGSYLSGGMDSGSITAIAASQGRRLSTFTCGFDLSSASGMELNFDERKESERMANAFKTEHYQVVLHAGDMEYILPSLIWHLEDPRVGQSYPNFYVARLASKFVKVSLSGTGGDELFAGYPWRYYRADEVNQKNDYFYHYYQYWQRLIKDEHKANFFNSSCFQNLSNENTFEIFKKVFENGNLQYQNKEAFLNASLYFESKTFLHGLLLVEDKLSMAHGLETRVPFLDNELVDFALQIPISMKINTKVPDLEGKLILRQAMKNLLPQQIISRKKQGFSAPDASWFRGDSINYLNKLLRDPKANIYEFLSRKYVLQVLDEHCTGQVNHRLLIWSLLSFEWWCRLFLNNEYRVRPNEFLDNNYLALNT